MRVEAKKISRVIIRMNINIHERCRVIRVNSKWVGT